MAQQVGHRFLSSKSEWPKGSEKSLSVQGSVLDVVWTSSSGISWNLSVDEGREGAQAKAELLASRGGNFKRSVFVTVNQAFYQIAAILELLLLLFTDYKKVQEFIKQRSKNWKMKIATHSSALTHILT